MNVVGETNNIAESYSHSSISGRKLQLNVKVFIRKVNEQTPSFCISKYTRALSKSFILHKNELIIIV